MLFSRLLESARSDSKENNATLSRCRCLISLLGAGFAVISTSEKRVAKLLASQTLSARRKEQDSRAETIARQNVLRLYLHISVRYYSNRPIIILSVSICMTRNVRTVYASQPGLEFDC